MRTRAKPTARPAKRATPPPRDPKSTSCIILKYRRFQAIFGYTAFEPDASYWKIDEFGLFSHMLQEPRPSLATYLTTLQSEGRIAFTRGEAIAALGITEAGFLKAAARLQKRHLLFNPRPRPGISML
jgi:hypothetical protein